MTDVNFSNAAQVYWASIKMRTGKEVLGINEPTQTELAWEIVYNLMAGHKGKKALAIEMAVCLAEMLEGDND